MKLKHKRGFSLVEMMVVMLLVAVVLAATAPMITRKVAREHSDKIFDILPSDPTNAVEYVKGRNQRIFMNGKDDGYVGIVESGVNVPANSILFGKNTVSGTDLVGIGFNTTNKSGSVAIGYNAMAAGTNSIAIGYSATAKAGTGNSTTTRNRKSKNSIAIGNNSYVKGDNSVALGFNASATGVGATAIGYNAVAARKDTIVLGTKDNTVYIPGNLVVGQNTILSYDGLYRLWIREIKFAEKFKDDPLNRGGGERTGWGTFTHVGTDYESEDDPYYSENGARAFGADRVNYGDTNYTWTYPGGFLIQSDLRLKDVNHEYTAGLDEIDKLKFYNYTFKNDKNKEPQVGVMAQDLQKVFQNAVTTGKDGYLKIRWDEMFYAALNAIKDLSAKVTELAQKVCQITTDVTDIKSTLDKQQATIDSQAKLIKEQQIELKNLSAKVEKLEKRK